MIHHHIEPNRQTHALFPRSFIACSNQKFGKEKKEKKGKKKRWREGNKKITVRNNNNKKKREMRLGDVFLLGKAFTA